MKIKNVQILTVAPLVIPSARWGKLTHSAKELKEGGTASAFCTHEKLDQLSKWNRNSSTLGGTLQTTNIRKSEKQRWKWPRDRHSTLGTSSSALSQAGRQNVCVREKDALSNYLLSFFINATLLNQIAFPTLLPLSHLFPRPSLHIGDVAN